MIDFTQIVEAAASGIISIATAVFLAWLQSHMKDKAAAATISNAVVNAEGAAKQALDAGLTSHPLQVSLPIGTSPAVAAGVAYVLGQAGPELTRLGITPDAVAAKIDAKIGLGKIAAQSAPSAIIVNQGTVT